MAKSKKKSSSNSWEKLLKKAKTEGKKPSSKKSAYKAKEESKPVQKFDDIPELKKLGEAKVEETPVVAEVTPEVHEAAKVVEPVLITPMPVPAPHHTMEIRNLALFLLVGGAVFGLFFLSQNVTGLAVARGTGPVTALNIIALVLFAVALVGLYVLVKKKQ
jgi:hypothetical protein